MLRHIPVLAEKILEYLPKKLTTYFDGTFGHGGHVEYLLSHLKPVVSVIACDRDPTILQKGLEFTNQRKANITPILDTYAHIDQI